MANIKNENILGTGRIGKLMVKYCLPAVIAMIITGIQGMIDGIFVGNYIGANALASVNIALPFVHLIIGVSMIISIGTQSYVGINLGAGNTQKAQNAFITFAGIIAAIAVLITIFGLTSNKQVASFLGADDVLLPDSSAYIMHLSMFALPTCIMFYFGFLCRIIGKPERYLYGTILSIIVNVSLDYLFIVHLDMGIKGAALATGIAFSSALIFVISPMLNRKNTVNIFTGKFSGKCILPVLYNGSSEGINSLSIAITAFLFNISLMNLVGPGGVTAFTAINYVGSMGSMLLFGISDGIGPIVSYNFGMHDYKRVKNIMKSAYIINFIFGVALFFLLFFFGEPLASLFIKDNPDLVALAVSGGKIYALTFFMSGFNILNSGYFTFIGKGLHSVLVAASRGLVFVSIGIFTLPTILDINGIWMSVPFAELCAVIVGIILLATTQKKLSKSSALYSYDGKVSKQAELPFAPPVKTSAHMLITVSRQFGSGGREIGKRVADALGIAYYDKEIINAISEETNINPVIIDELDSTASRNYGYSFGKSILTYKQPNAQDIAKVKSNTLKRLAQKSSCVIIGRCSDYILDEFSPFKVYVYSSDMQFKTRRCFEKVPKDKTILSEREMIAEISQIDKNRAKYYEQQTGAKWADMTNYNLCIDTSKVGIKHAVDIILKAISANT